MLGCQYYYSLAGAILCTIHPQLLCSFWVSRERERESLWWVQVMKELSFKWHQRLSWMKYSWKRSPDSWTINWRLVYWEKFLLLEESRAIQELVEYWWIWRTRMDLKYCSWLKCKVQFYKKFSVQAGVSAMN